MCRNQHDPHFERELAAFQEARGGDSSGESQEESRAEQVVQGGTNYRSCRIHFNFDRLRADSTAAGQSAETSEEGRQWKYAEEDNALFTLKWSDLDSPFNNYPFLPLFFL